MVQITMTPDEPAKLITLMERTYGVNLGILQGIIKDANITGELTLVKTIPGTADTVKVTVTVR